MTNHNLYATKHSTVICSEINYAKCEQKHYLYARSTYEIISKQVLWLTPYKIISHFYTLPSQFPNDRLSPTSIKTSEHTPTVSRRGFTPHSLSTDYILTYPAFYNVTDTLCDDIKFYILQYTTLYYISQPKNGFVQVVF